MGTLIQVSSLIEDDIHSSVKSDNFFLIDCRSSLGDPDYGLTQYQLGHIPGAHYLHLETDLSGPIVPGKTGRHPLPDRDILANTLSNLGLSKDHNVVIYDDAGGAYAARCWWLLRWLGHENTHVLDGGISAWIDSGHKLEQDLPSLQPSSGFLTTTPLTQQILVDDMLSSKLKLTDARALARFNGEVEPIDPVAGHIPSAVCMPFSQNLTESGYFKSSQDLSAHFEALGISTEESTVCYCGSGVTACHNILALVHAGYPEPVLYAGSWSEWITQTERPIATSTQTDPGT